MRWIGLVSRLLLAAVLALPLASQAEKMKPEELVARHLDSIGTAEARAAVKDRFVEGNVALTVVVGGQGIMEGPGALTSQGRRLKCIMRFDRPDYFGEEFIFDGQKSFTGMYRPGARSQLGAFMLAQDAILKEGLLGGTLSTAWPLLDLSGHDVKLKYDGLKKVDGRQLHQLTYEARKGWGDLTAKLYFEPETFRHVYSVYTVEMGAGLGTASVSLKPGDMGSGPQTTSGEANSARQDVTRLKLEEYFSDFTTVNGLTLPSTWKLKFTSESQRSMILEYLFKAARIEDNVVLPENAFQPSGASSGN